MDFLLLWQNVNADEFVRFHLEQHQSICIIWSCQFYDINICIRSGDIVSKAPFFFRVEQIDFVFVSLYFYRKMMKKIVSEKRIVLDCTLQKKRSMKKIHHYLNWFYVYFLRFIDELFLQTQWFTCRMFLGRLWRI